ncbi:3482_t:CDS:10 [Entrophospora sp. SA101]|nr:3482_t:CDS:10 [Entrophospora sp. SA101]
MFIRTCSPTSMSCSPSTRRTLSPTQISCSPTRISASPAQRSCEEQITINLEIRKILRGAAEVGEQLFHVKIKRKRWYDDNHVDNVQTGNRSQSNKHNQQTSPGQKFSVSLKCTADQQTCQQVQGSFDAAGKFITNTFILNTITVNASFISFCEGQPNCSQDNILDDDGIQRLYPQALVKQFNYETHPEYGQFDIIALFNSDAAWWFSSSPSAPINSTQYDFLYTLIHELFHGLGFGSSWDEHYSGILTPVPGPNPLTANGSSTSTSVDLNDNDYIKFYEWAFDKYIKLLKDGTNLTTYAQEINKFFTGEYTNITGSQFESKFKGSPQYNIAKNMDLLAVTANSLGFIPTINFTNVNDSAVILETSLIPYRVGSSISHVDKKLYANTSDFLMKYDSETGVSLDQLVSRGGNYSGGPIGPKLKLVMETLGYATLENPNPYKPQIIPSNKNNNSNNNNSDNNQNPDKKSLENSIIFNNKNNKSRLTDFVERPDYGTKGRAINVRTNFFRITSLPESNIIHYDVTISPDVPPVINRKVYEEFEALHRNEALGGIKPVFDGRKNVFSPRPLALHEDAGTFDVTIPEDDSITTSKRPPRIFKIKIRKVGVINMDELIQYTERKGRLTPSVLTALMALDVLIRHQPSMKYITVGRSFFTPTEATPLFGGLEVWRGFYQSAKPGQNRMFINIDLSATAFYESCPLIVMVTKILGRRNPEDLRRGMNDKDHQRLERALKGLKIRVVHRGDTTAKRKFKIKGITPTPADRTVFNSAEGQMNVATYFANTYGRRLNQPFLPCVVVRNDVFLPMEVCEIVENQRFLRKLNDKQTADMIKFTCLQPHVRANKILNGITLLNYRDNEYLRQFGLRVNGEMEVVPRILPTPTVQYHASSRESNFQPRDGVWNLRDKKVATGSTLGSWSVVVFSSERDLPLLSIKAFIRELVVTCQNTGMKIPNVNPPVVHANPQGDIEGTLKQAWLRAGNHAKAQPQLILCVLPNTGVDLYAEIKRVSDTVIGVVTQCVQGRNTLSPKKQYCANVCLKMNVKLGGMNSFLDPNEIPFISEVPTILMGSTNKPSIAALCASMDAKASRYAASIRVQSGRTDIIADLSSMVKELLKTFYQTCGRKPDRILFYRDGISESQFSKVLKEEINSVKGIYVSLQADYSPKITFVVVQKRHHTRFFAMDKKDADNTGNCLPGIVVERDITSPVPPVYYAHLVCNRARFHSRAQWSDTESSESGGIASTFSVVKPELQKG